MDEGRWTEDEWHERFPSIDTAYEFVLPSYEWALRRFEAIDSRLQNSLAILASATFAGPTLVKVIEPTAQLKSPLLFAVGGVFVVATVVGGLFRYYGGLILPSPKGHFDDYLDQLPRRFKKNQIYWAGEHREHNHAIIERKARAAVGLSFALALELGLLAVWALISL